jgi:hypothetical protein
MGSQVSFKRPDGQSVEGYLAEAAGSATAGGPAVVVIQEWWGLNAQIRGVADRLAQAGYTALVPDLYRGRSTVEAEEAHHLMTGLNFADAASQDVRGAVQHLLAQGASRVGVTGFCMGGALTVLSLSDGSRGGRRRRLVRAAAARVRRRVPDPCAHAGPLGRAGRRVPDRQRAAAGGQADGCRRRLHRPPLPGPARLRQRDGTRARAACPSPSTTPPGRKPPGTARCASSGARWAEPWARAAPSNWAVRPGLFGASGPAGSVTFPRNHSRLQGA